MQVCYLVDSSCLLLGVSMWFWRVFGAKLFSNCSVSERSVVGGDCGGSTAVECSAGVAGDAPRRYCLPLRVAALPRVSRQGLNPCLLIWQPKIHQLVETGVFRSAHRSDRLSLVRCGQTRVHPSILRAIRWYSREKEHLRGSESR